MTIPPRVAAGLSDGPPVVPRPSASVLLVDAATRPWRLLMMQRPGGANFAPGAWVFPGGGLHEEDRGQPDPQRAAAVRELFEEVGLLLARRAGEDARDADCESLRAELAGGLTFWQAIAACSLEPAFDRLAFCTRWITPEPLPRRYDTYFYLARRPPAQTVHPQPGEVVEWRWMDPNEALGDSRLELIHATRRILELVAAAPDAGQLDDELRDRPETPPITPRLVPQPDGTVRIVDDARPLF